MFELSDLNEIWYPYRIESSLTESERIILIGQDKVLQLDWKLGRVGAYPLSPHATYPY